MTTTKTTGTPKSPPNPTPPTGNHNGTHASSTPAQAPKPHASRTPSHHLSNGATAYTPSASPNHRPLPRDGVFRPPYGWKYHYQLEEAVDVPEFVVPWEGFRALAEEYGLELMYRKGFREVLDEIWEDGRDEEDGGAMNRELGVLAERMGVAESRPKVVGRAGGNGGCGVLFGVLFL